MIDANIGKFLIERHSTCREHHNSKANDNVFVLVETRQAFWLPYVIRNAVNVLGPSWNVHLFVSRNVATSLQEDFRHCTFDVTVIRDTLTVPMYSNMLKGPLFWSTIVEEHVLVGQLDAVILRPIPRPFFEYAFVGAPCGDISNLHFVLNGGFSLRKRSIMLSVTQKYPDESVAPADAEDMYFTRHLRATKQKLPSLTDAARFCCETIVTESPIGIHGTNKYWIASDRVQRLLSRV